LRAATEPKSGTATITLEVSGFRSNDGQALVALFVRDVGFPADPIKGGARYVSAAIKDKKLRLTLSAEAGRAYAISVLHDENRNNKVDTNLLGIPKEGVGVSQNPKSRLGPPTFDEGRFELPASGATLKIVMTYF
jgi:uncharacterized protein (DUF2141 family)